MARIDELQKYLTENRANKGKPEYDAANAEYNALADQEDAARQQQAGGTKDEILARAAPGPHMMQDPGGRNATAARAVGNILLGLPDLVTHIGNASIRMSEKYGIPLGAGVSGPLHQAPIPSELFNKYMGVPEAPPGGGRAIAEGALAALFSSPWNVVKAAFTNSPSLIKAAGKLASETTTKAIAPATPATTVANSAPNTAKASASTRRPPR